MLVHMTYREIFNIRRTKSQNLIVSRLVLQLSLYNLPDIGKTFGPLPDQRTGNHMEKHSFTGPPKLLQD